MSEENGDLKASDAHPSDQVTPAEKQMNELKELADKYKNDFLYLRAEFDNYKKHVIKERADLLKYGSERFVVELLNVIDNFDRALELTPSPENYQTYAKGIEMTATELRSVLSKFSVTAVDCDGKPFDPNIHEALGSEPSSNLPEGHILKTLKKPYKMHDKLIRPGQVIVARAPSNS